MNFFDSFWKKSFYQDGNANSFWKAFWKVILVTFVVSVAYSIIFYVTVGKKIPSFLYTYSGQALDGFPQDLVITIKDGELTKNIPGKLQLYPIPSEAKNLVTNGTVLPAYMITIDDGVVSFDAYKNADSFVLLAKDGVAVEEEEGVKISSYEGMEKHSKEFVFSKDDIQKGVTFINQYAEIIPGLSIAFIIIFLTVFSPLFYLLMTLFYGLVVMLLSKWLTGREGTFTESYILALYALAPVILVSTILHNIPYIKNIVVYIPLLTMILIVAFLVLMYKGDDISEQDTNVAQE